MYVISKPQNGGTKVRINKIKIQIECLRSYEFKIVHWTWRYHINSMKYKKMIIHKLQFMYSIWVCGIGCNASFVLICLSWAWFTKSYETYKDGLFTDHKYWWGYRQFQSQKNLTVHWYYRYLNPFASQWTKRLSTLCLLHYKRVMYKG